MSMMITIVLMIVKYKNSNTNNRRSGPTDGEVCRT